MFSPKPPAFFQLSWQSKKKIKFTAFTPAFTPTVTQTVLHVFIPLRGGWVHTHQLLPWWLLPVCLLLLFAGQLCGISPHPRNGRTALIPAYIRSVRVPSHLSKAHRFVSHRSVKPCAKRHRRWETQKTEMMAAYESTWPIGKLVHGDLAAGVSVQEGVHKLAVILSFPWQISDVVELPYKTRQRFKISHVISRCHQLESGILLCSLWFSWLF